MTNKTPVIYVIPHINVGGVEKILLDSCHFLAENGWQTIVISNGGRMESKFPKSTQHIRLPVHSKNPFVMFINAIKIANICRKMGAVPILHALSRAPAWSCLLAKKWVQCHFITSFQAVYGHDGLKLHYSAVMTRADKIITISQFLNRHIQKIYHIPAEKIAVLYNAVNMNQFNNEPLAVARKELIFKQLPYYDPINQKLFIMVGRLGHTKGHELLIRAIGYIAQNHPQCDLSHYHFAMVGVGDMGSKIAELTQLAQEVGCVSLSFYPFIDDLSGLYKLSDCVLSCSTQPEGFGLTQIEAGASGVPVIAPTFPDDDWGPSPEIINDGQTGLLFHANNIEHLAQKILEFMAMPRESQKNMGALAHQRVKQNFTTTIFAEQLSKFYNNLINNH